MHAHIPSFGKSNQLKKNTFPCFPKVSFLSYVARLSIIFSVLHDGLLSAIEQDNRFIESRLYNRRKRALHLVIYLPKLS